MATTSSYQERKVRRRVITLLLLLLSLALISWLAYNYIVHKVVPVPNVEALKATDKIIPPEYIFSLDGIPNSPLSKPQDVLVAKNGKIYVTDTDNGRVVCFDRGGQALFSFKNMVNGLVLRRPLYLAQDGKGRIYVSDRELGNIFIFDENGKFISPFYPNRQTDMKYQWRPLEMAFDKSGNLYVTSVYPKHHLMAFAPDGKLKFDVGETGQVTKATDNPKTFDFPNGVVVDPNNGDVYVADSDNGRIQIFDKKGKYKRIVSTNGLPRGIVWDYRGRLMVVDTLGHSIMVYSKKGELLTTFGVSGYGAGQFQYPNGLDFSPSDRRVYITDRDNNRVQVWVFGPDVPLSAAAPIRAAKNWWWILPLLLLLWYLWGKRKKHLMHEDFLQAALATNMLPRVVEKMKRLHVTEEVMEKYKDLEIEKDKKFEDVIKTKTYFEDLVGEFMKEFKIEKPAATILSAGKKGRGRMVLLAEDEELLDAADAVDIKNMNFGDFLEKYVEGSEER
ncbi:MAG: SMP-30/gluconolactonase/LRE family protein [Chloroflexi bacterium]|nr:SMP-30/gluconolactonase/LRE family protein [Chloroflexota bacterium]